MFGFVKPCLTVLLLTLFSLSFSPVDDATLPRRSLQPGMNAQKGLPDDLGGFIACSGIVLVHPWQVVRVNVSGCCDEGYGGGGGTPLFPIGF